MREQDISEQNDAKDRAVEIAQEQRDANREANRFRILAELRLPGRLRSSPSRLLRAVV
jgi:hypothetical protein